MAWNNQSGSFYDTGTFRSERRENPRFNTSFLKRNLTASSDNQGIIYDGLVSIINISRDGMCVQITIPDMNQASQYESGKQIEVRLDMPFCGKVVACRGTIAWIKPDFKPQTYRMGLQFHHEAFSSTALLDLFDEEKKAQRQFFNRLI